MDFFKQKRVPFYSGDVKLYGYQVDEGRLIFRTVFNNKTYLYLVEKESGEKIGHCFDVDKDLEERVKKLINKGN